MMFRRTVSLLSVLLLSGCGMWSGPTFYPVDKSYSWLPPGTYRVQSEGKSHYGRWDGKAFFDLPSGKRQKQDDMVVTMVALAGTKLDTSIAQVSAAHGNDGAIYALVVRRGNSWTYAFPDCAATRRIVTDAGGIMDGPAGLGEQATTEPVRFADLAGDSLPHSATTRGTKPVKSVQASRDNGGSRYGNQSCHFPTRESLEAAARRYLAERQLIGDKIVRIGD